MLFKDGIEPKWEDPENLKGGSFILEIDMREEDNIKIS